MPLAALALGVLLGLFAITAGASEPQGEYVVVRHLLYLSADGSIAIEEESTTRVSAAYVVNDHLWAEDALPIRVAYNPAGAPAGHDVPALLQQAIGTWNAAGSGFAFEWAGTGSALTGSCGQAVQVDGVNNIQFAALPPLVLGQTCTIYPPPKNSATKLVEFDMQLNPAINWSSTLPVPGGKYDMGTTILHELGHAAGLGHNCGPDVQITCQGKHDSAVMYSTLVTGISKRVLTQDDIDAIREAYGAAPTPPPTPTPTPVVTVPPGAEIFERARAPQLARD